MQKLLLALLGAALVAGAAPHARAQAVLPTEESRVISMVNATRAEHGLGPLKRHDGLVDVARRQSARMLEQDRLHHNPDLRGDLDALGLSWSWSGENVGVGPNVDEIENAFLASPSHYENIVRPNYTALGIGVIGPTKTGAVYVTQVFAELAPTAPALASSPEATPPRPSSAPTPARTPPPQPTPRANTAPTPEPHDHVVIQGGVTTGSPVPARP